MLSWLRPRIPTTKRRRIAVIGIYGSGKTVFLTSLINHLKNHSPEAFDLDGRSAARIKRFVEVEHGGNRPFRFAAHRQHLLDEQAWPAKTYELCHYRCRFKRSDTGRRYDVDFIDFPGERIADAGIYQAANFAAWSDDLFDRWASADRNYREQLADYEATLARPDAGADDVLRAYRAAACRLLLAYKPLIAPSCFLLGVKQAAEAGEHLTAEALADCPTALLGLDVHSQFAPLDREARSRWPDVAAKFAQDFARYKAQEVRPFIDELVRVDRLIVLVDIPMILNAGPGLLNDCHAILGELFRAIHPGGWLRRLFGLARRTPTKIAFVANKADLVADEDRDNLKALLREMCDEYENALDRVTCDYFCASPIKSTHDSTRRPDAESAWLVGRPLRDELGNALSASAAEREYRTSRVPARWPSDWQVGHFRFPMVHPRVSKAVFQPPGQIDLPRLFEFVVE